MNKVSKINIIYLITVIISLIGMVISSILYQKTNNMLYVLLSSQVMLVLPGIFYIIVNKLNLRKTIRFHKIKISNIILIILFSYMILPLMSLVNLISMLFVQNDIQNTVEEILSQNPLYISVLTIALIPAIFEEFVYRGIFYNEYRKVNLRKGILLSACLFALLHLNFNQFFYAFLMGAIFALLIEATDSIVSSMVVHFMINGTSVINAYMLPMLSDLLEEVDPVYANDLAESMEQGLSRTDLLVSIYSFAPIAIITTIIAIVILIVIAKNSGRLESLKSVFTGEDMCYKEIPDNKLADESSNGWIGDSIEYGEVPGKKKESLITIPIIISIIVCVALMIINEVF